MIIVIITKQNFIATRRDTYCPYDTIIGTGFRSVTTFIPHAHAHTAR